MNDDWPDMRRLQAAGELSADDFHTLRELGRLRAAVEAANAAGDERDRVLALLAGEADGDHTSQLRWWNWLRRFDAGERVEPPDCGTDELQNAGKLLVESQSTELATRQESRLVALLDPVAKKVIDVADNQSLSVSEKLLAIYVLDGRYRGKASAELAKLLKCSDSAIRAAAAWKERHK